MVYAKMPAIELQREIKRAVYYSEDNGTALLDALKEIERLRTVCQDIIEVISVEYGQSDDSADAALNKIDDIAHRYFTG